MTRCVEFYDKWRADPTWRECSRSEASVSEINKYLDFIDTLEKEHGIDRNIAIKNISEGAVRQLRSNKFSFVYDEYETKFNAAVISDIIKELQKDKPKLTGKLVKDIINTNGNAVTEMESAARVAKHAEGEQRKYLAVIDKIEAHGVERDFAIANLSEDLLPHVEAIYDSVQVNRVISELAEVLNGPAPTVNADVVNNIINRTGAREEAPEADNKTPSVVLEDRDDENIPYKYIALFGGDDEHYLDGDVIAAINKYQIPIFDKINEIIRKWLEVEGYT